MLSLTIVAVVLMGGLMISQSVYALEIIGYYDIPAQSLNNALLQFAADAHLELVFSADLVRGFEAGHLIGAMTPEQALQSLLKDSGLGYRFLDQRTVMLLQGEQVRQGMPEHYPAVLEAMTVVGRAASGERVTDDNPTDISPLDFSNYRVAAMASATRTDTPLMQIPQSVQAFKRSLIEDQQNVTVSESLYNASSVVPRNIWFTPNVEGTLIRGFKTEQLLDGFTQYYNTGDRESLVNLEGIEVLKGASAVLYGGGSGAQAGGVINLLSKQPRAKAFGELGIKIGGDSFYQPFFDFNQPLAENALFRISGEYTDSGSTIDGIETQRYNLNPALTLTDNDKTRFTLRAKLSRWQQPDYQGLPATGTVAGSFRIPRQTLIGPDNLPDSHSATDAVWVSLDHRINERWSVTVKARYSYSEFIEHAQTLFGRDGFTADRPLFASTWALVNAELAQQQEERSFAGYAVGKFDFGPTENTVLFGADHSELNDQGYIDGDVGPAGFGVGMVDLAAPDFSSAYRRPGPGVSNRFVDNITYGGYAQLQTTLYKRLHLLSSMRLGTVNIDFKNTVSDNITATDTSKWLPRFGVVVDLTEQISWFSGYSEGMRGQPLINFVDTPVPELSRQIETGFKFDFAGQFSGQMAIYQIDRTHVAVTDNTDIQGRSVAAGQQRSVGFDADLLWQPLDELNFLASYAHTEARFIDDKSGVPAGNRLPLVPENSARLWMHYRLPMPELKGLSLGFGVNLRAGAFLSNNNQFKSEAYHGFDATVAYETATFKLAATAKNLTGVDYFSAYDYFDGRVAPDSGPAVYVTGSVRY
ncbi:TonB-dependent receptor [Methylomonas sp. LL1]|nr:TonB-dependent receptor [Methylomonas sp. LL1]